MPVNYEQLRPQIVRACRGIKESRKAAAQQRTDLMKTFRETEASDLNERMAEILTSFSEEKFAVPGTDAIGAGFPAPSQPEAPVRILACDGSQITPNPHDELSFGLINTAVFEYCPHSGQTPRIFRDTRYHESDGSLTEGRIGVMRDAAEKTHLAVMAEELQGELPILALCDGSLELFMESREIKDLAPLKEQYLEAMVRLDRLNVPAVGYIDRPRSNPVLTMLALLNGTTAEESYGQLCDADLFSQLLLPGERSAVFGMNSRFNASVPQELQICFFYLNVGRPQHPYLSRVELTSRTAADPSQVDRIHANLLEQAGLLNDHPYPYVLHRAHECAVVTYREKDQIKDMLIRELIRNGEWVGEKSNKQFAKDLIS